MAHRTVTIEFAEKHSVAIGNSYSHCMNCLANYLGNNTCRGCGTNLEFGATAGSGSDELLAAFCKRSNLIHLSDWYAVGSNLLQRSQEGITIDMSHRNRK